MFVAVEVDAPDEAIKICPIAAFDRRVLGELVMVELCECPLCLPDGL